MDALNSMLLLGGSVAYQTPPLNELLLMKLASFAYSCCRSACGNVLDTLETDNYKIIVDDALKWLAAYK
jgi:hypothetical protein